MKALYFDCFSGVSGNMIFAALLDSGLDEALWRQQLGRLPLEGVQVRLSRVHKSGISALHGEVDFPREHVHRRLSDCLAIVGDAGYAPEIAARAEQIFRRLAEAEASVHAVGVEEVHFHEVGAVDAIVDIVSAAILLEMAQVDRILASPIRTGFGTVHTAHGEMPVPAPATALLLRGIPSYAGEIEAEMATPTGAAILAAHVDGFGHQPHLITEAIGYGAGSLDLPLANCLRVLRGELVEREGVTLPSGLVEEEILEIECQVDDMTGEQLAFLSEQLFATKALDVIFQPVQMKKGRPGSRIRVLAEVADETAVLTALFLNSSSLGARVHRSRRVRLPRERVEVETPWGRVSAKQVSFAGRGRIHPEFEDCAALAKEHGIAVGDVMAAARNGQIGG